MRTLIIGDIHGCNKTFNALIDKIALSTLDHLFLLGDYIDRGPDSKGVLDTIFNLKEAGFQVSCLRGNHEEMMLNAFLPPDIEEEKDDDDGNNEDVDYLKRWLKNGGKETLNSFGKSNVQEIPPQYLYFLAQLPFYIETEDLILVHAGLDFHIKNPFDNLEEMIWIRDWYKSINDKWLGERTIVHGHTPIPCGRIEFLFEKRNIIRAINLDGGAIFSLKGRPDCALCCMDWTNKKLYFQDTVDN